MSGGSEKEAPFQLLGVGRKTKQFWRKSPPRQLNLSPNWPPSLHGLPNKPEGNERLPREVLCILPLQFGEQYCNTSVRGMLNLFLQAAGLDADTARMQVHLFGALIYGVPLFGGALADLVLGRYIVGLLATGLLLFGMMLLNIFSIEGLMYLRLGVNVALALIGVGLGLLKPCLQALASHQIEINQTRKALDKYFGLGFAVGSLGIVLASFLAPLLTGIGCGGSQECYPIGFGVATLVIAVAGLFFVLGSRETGSPSRGDGEVKNLLAFFIMSLPLAFFWMLYDQSATSWQAQYELMNHNWLGFSVRTELMANVGCLMLVVLIPLLNQWIDPLLESKKLRLEGIPRMSVGFLMLIIGFIISNVVQVWVEGSVKGSHILRHAGRVSLCTGCLSGAWQFPQWFFLALGEALLGTATPQVAYKLGGSRFRALGPGLLLMTNALGNVLIIVLDAAPLHGLGAIPRMWCYICLASVANLVFVVMYKKWYQPRQFNYFPITNSPVSLI
ncbi:hypothetical protein DSO57_1002455 [Entomophthora muscae]|uniref:Uncharacterized protein n=1 Tax=Entomophthora muscae TaxID=34485 RepID=A0ACC2RZW7_9FUNG|nr:hypothetical protein DSO57_1002455 [Entomophthora muscae]